MSSYEIMSAFEDLLDEAINNLNPIQCSSLFNMMRERLEELDDNTYIDR